MVVVSLEVWILEALAVSRCYALAVCSRCFRSNCLRTTASEHWRFYMMGAAHHDGT